MAWASTDLVPIALNLQSKYSVSAAAFLNDIDIKLVPQSSNGTKFDFTAATALLLAALVGSALPTGFQIGLTTVPTMVSHDSTGLALKITAANQGGITSETGTLSIPITLTATDGTTNLLVGSGTMTVSVVP